MKHSAAEDYLHMLHKIEALEKEVLEIKLSLLQETTPAHGKIVKLRGILKGVDITDKEITAAQKKLSGKVKI